MKKFLKKFNFAWIIIFLTPFFILALYSLKAHPVLQMQILILFALAYLMLAILHHYQTKTLTFEIIIEYILIAALVLIIFL